MLAAQATLLVDALPPDEAAPHGAGPGQRAAEPESETGALPAHRPREVPPPLQEEASSPPAPSTWPQGGGLTTQQVSGLAASLVTR